MIYDIKVSGFNTDCIYKQLTYVFTDGKGLEITVSESKCLTKFSDIMFPYVIIFIK